MSGDSFGDAPGGGGAGIGAGSSLGRGKTLMLAGGETATFTTHQQRLVTEQERHQAARHGHMLAMPKKSEHDCFVIPPSKEGGTRSVTGDWVYGHHIAASEKHSDGSYTVAGRKMTEYQYNNLRERLQDSRSTYVQRMRNWESEGKFRRYM